MPTRIADQTWRSDDEGKRFALRITETGLVAIRAVEGKEQAAVARKASERGKEPTTAGSGPQDKAAAKPAAEPVPSLPGIRPGTKQARLVGLLRQPWGATIADLSKILGWQPHTVRAALTGLRKKGYRITGSKDETGTTVYRTTLPAPRRAKRDTTKDGDA